MAEDKRVRQSTTDSSERILHQMKHELNAVKPTEEMKERSFQAALHGVRQARRKAARQRKLRRIRDVVTLTAVTAAALFLVFQFMLDGEELPGERARGSDSHDEQVQPSEPNEQPLDPAYESETEPEEEETDAGEGDDSTDQPANLERPEWKEIVTYPEGMEERTDYYLFQPDHLPFSTYIYPEWEAADLKPGADVPGGEETTGIRIAPRVYDYMEMNILFFPPHIAQNEVEEYILRDLIGQNPYVHPPAAGEEEPYWADWELEDWAVQSYRYQDDQQGRNGYVYLGNHEGQWFLVHESFIQESEAGPHRSLVIYQEWIWTDTGEPLTERVPTWLP